MFFAKNLKRTNRNCTSCFDKRKKMGWYKRALIAAQRQAKFYLPWQAAVPQEALLMAPQYTRYSFIPHILRLVYCGQSSLLTGDVTKWRHTRRGILCTLAPCVLQQPQYKKDSFSPLCTAPRILQRLVYCRSRHWCAAVWVLLYGPPKNCKIWCVCLENCTSWRP